MQITQPDHVWISYPTTYIGGPASDVTQRPPVENDSAYARLHAIFRHPHEAEAPTTVHDANGLLVWAAQLLLERTGVSPDLFVDCRSSAALGGPAPTYQAVYQLGVPDALPFALSGQGGSELTMALLFLSDLLQTGGSTALVSTTQHVSETWQGDGLTRFPRAAASAAILVSDHAPPFPSLQLRVIGLSQGNLEGGHMHSDLQQLWAGLVTVQPAVRSRTTRMIAHTDSPAFSALLRAICGEALWFTRTEDQQINFGCADPLISLQALDRQGVLAPGDQLVLWLSGAFGALSVLAVEVAG